MFRLLEKLTEPSWSSLGVIYVWQEEKAMHRGSSTSLKTLSIFPWLLSSGLQARIPK